MQYINSMERRGNAYLNIDITLFFVHLLNIWKKMFSYF